MTAMQQTRKQKSKPSLQLTDRFTRAVDYARQVHIDCRKGTEVPYMAHLLGVASLVMGENGYVSFQITEDTVIGALLHDAVEDEGGWPRLRDIEAKFGKEAAGIVEGCTDSFEEDSSKKQGWEIRKRAYLKRLPNESPGTLLVSAADKLYNARAVLDDYRQVGEKVWKRFNRGRGQQLWYFESLIEIYEKKGANRIVEELKRVVDELRRVSAGA
jgi:GTP pyrophosphokinase